MKQIKKPHENLKDTWDINFFIEIFRKLSNGGNFFCLKFEMEIVSIKKFFIQIGYTMKIFL